MVPIQLGSTSGRLDPPLGAKLPIPKRTPTGLGKFSHFARSAASTQRQAFLAPWHAMLQVTGSNKQPTHPLTHQPTNRKPPTHQPPANHQPTDPPTDPPSTALQATRCTRPRTCGCAPSRPRPWRWPGVWDMRPTPRQRCDLADSRARARMRASAHSARARAFVFGVQVPQREWLASFCVALLLFFFLFLYVFAVCGCCCFCWHYCVLVFLLLVAVVLLLGASWRSRHLVL